MLRKDAFAVLKGLKLVTDAAIRNGKPDVINRLKTVQAHLKDMAEMLIEVFQDSASNPTKSNQEKSTSAKTNDESSNNATQKMKARLDPTGFADIAESITSSIEDLSDEVLDRSKMRERAVPSSQIERVVGFGSLAARMSLGAVSNRALQFFSGNDSPRSSLTDENAERLAETLCRMRGAALKIGQMLSLQDEGMLPPALSKALNRVKSGADYMPKRQLFEQIARQLGTHSFFAVVLPHD
jgi:aarF domain-containing kinase